MSIESISAISSTESVTAITSVFETKRASELSFTDHLNGYLNDVNKMINTADMNLRELAVGETGNIHEVLMSIEKAKTAMELGLQVRNRLLEGYQEIMRMQV